METTEDDRTPKARTILIPFVRPFWQNALVPVVGLAVLLGSYTATIVLLGGIDVAASPGLDAIFVRRRARIVSTFVVSVYFALATGFAYGWPMLNLMVPIFLPMFLPSSAYVLFQGPVPERVFTAYGADFGMGNYGLWYADNFWLGIVGAVGLLGTLLLFERLYLTTPERKQAFVERLPEF
ncbi:hypothetical protein [Halorussus halophilus]|uniref:hypothetical protein n=1 Tax=Halorussus halophilus TaxID=2650975 RepID=UPI001300DEFB|nr:hypothetical protein [Halorussus halophilus]